MSFAAYKEWAIPEGKVKQVTDEAGNVLWSAVKPATIKVTGSGSADCVGIWHNENNWEYYYGPATFTANIGDTITCRLTECWDNQYLYINNEYVEGGYGENDISYEYTVVSDAVIDLYQYDGSTKRERVGKIKSTEIPEGAVLLTVNGNSCSVMIDGESYYDGMTAAVLPGTVVECNNNIPGYNEKESWIRVNGKTVVDGCGTYNYIATKNATIEMSSERDPYGKNYYRIEITEE